MDDGLLAIRRIFAEEAREKARISPTPTRKLGVMHSLSRPLTFTPTSVGLVFLWVVRQRLMI
jgi:hypothetical protein